MKLFLNEKLGEISLQIDESENAKSALIIAHGAGAGMDHPFLSALAKEIAKQKTHVVRFNFPYMEKGRKAPGSPKEAVLTWELVIERVRNLFPDHRLFISGKSYGGRMASHLLAGGDAMDISGIIYFGFPLHAPGKDSVDRASHLSSITVPQLFIQGTKDKLANIELIQEVIAGINHSELEIIEEGDHSFNVPKRTGIGREEMILTLASVAGQWMDHIALRS